ncbi:hypothetical protein E2C01_058945 [Portunus trituberculatus]|uniref:Uncharacterized protein n=1 Tax=Portunus trituberculatus TaxID=210409 RepID=A0A5B7H7Q9_PORTR|nr:hypothetical protein [Portunus trituberculatus]
MKATTLLEEMRVYNSIRQWCVLRFERKPKSLGNKIGLKRKRRLVSSIRSITLLRQEGRLARTCLCLTLEWVRRCCTSKHWPQNPACNLDYRAVAEGYLGFSGAT